MSDFKKLIDSLDPLSGENLSAFNESEVNDFIKILKSTQKTTDEFVKQKKKRVKLDKFLDNKETREEKKREAEDKRRKKVRLEDTVEVTDEKLDEDTEDGLMKGLIGLLASGALQSAVFAANPELATKIKLKKLQGKLIKFKPPKPKTPKPPTGLADEAVDIVRGTETAGSATRRATEVARAVNRTTRGGNIISRIFGGGLSGGVPKPPSVPIGNLAPSTSGVRRARVEVEIPGKGFRTVQDTGKVNNLLQEIRDKAVKNGFTPSEASRYANSWKGRLLDAARVSKNSIGILGRGILKSLPFIGAGLGYISAQRRESEGFTRLAALERTIAGADVAVGVMGATGVGSGSAAAVAMGTFLADMGLLVVDLVDMVTGDRQLGSNAVEYFLSKLQKRKVIRVTDIKDPKFTQSQEYQDYINQYKQLNPTGARFQRGGRVRKYQSGGSVDQIALKTIKHHEALSSVTPGGRNDYIKVGGRSVISGTPWSKINDNTKIYAYRDSKGIPTIGWGTVTQPSGRQTQDGDVITKQKADQLLNWNYQNMKNYMARVIPTWGGMSPSQQAAIMSLTYNTGPGWFSTSGSGAWPNLTRAIASGDFRGALRHWTGSDAVLEPRRKDERVLFAYGPDKPNKNTQKPGDVGKVDYGFIGKVKSFFGFQEGGSIGTPQSLELMSPQGMLLSLDNSPMSVVGRGGASSVNEMKQFEKIARLHGLKFQSGGLVLFSGHGDILDVNGTNGLIGSINGETAEQHYTKKVASAIRDKSGGKIKYIQSQVKWRAKSDPEPTNSNWNLGKRQASAGNVPIELHFDAPGGRSGLITSNLNRPVSQAEKGLISGFGSISGDYGAGKYGVSMLELEPMGRSVAVGALADKFIKSVEGKYGTVTTDTSTDTTQQSTQTQSMIPSGGVGMMSGVGSIIPGVGEFMKGLAQGFSETSGIDFGNLFGTSFMPVAQTGTDSQTPTNLPFSPMQPTRSNDEAFRRIYDIAKRLGDPVPELTAAQAMYESGWLTSRLAREANNPFGQSGTGNAGTISYKDRTWAKYATLDDAIRSRINRWANTTPKGGPGYASAGGAPIPGLKAILETYAPSRENNHPRYISTVSSILQQFGFDPNRKNSGSIRVASRQYGGFMDNSIQSRIVKQMISGSYSNINNQESPVIIVNQPQPQNTPIPDTTTSIPKFSFEYIIGDGTDGFVMNELYGLLKLTSV